MPKTQTISGSSEIAKFEISMGEPEAGAFSETYIDFGLQTWLEHRKLKSLRHCRHHYLTIKLSSCEFSFDTVLNVTAQLLI